MRQKYTEIFIKKDGVVVGLAKGIEISKYKTEIGKVPKTEIVLDILVTSGQFYDVFDVYVVTKDVEVHPAKDEHSHDIVREIIDTCEVCFKDCCVTRVDKKFSSGDCYCVNRIKLECFDSKERSN